MIPATVDEKNAKINAAEYKQQKLGLIVLLR
jgi:hypothetical protein